MEKDCRPSGETIRGNNSYPARVFDDKSNERLFEKQIDKFRLCLWINLEN